MAIAIRVDPAMIADIRSDADNQLVLLKVIRASRSFIIPARPETRAV